MNLIKSFNFSFLKQNIRKSKGAIILSLIIVPLFLSMYLVVSGIGLRSPEVVSITTISVMDLIFMYIIPFVYSVLLFGFVFKKPSTDFMNSMPINRTTMFVTNTIGGILLITIVQLLSGFFVLLWGAIFSNLIIFPAAILEIMIVSWISYVFVFTASNLAMSFSGTQQAQFVSVVLILFLIPVLTELLGVIKSYQNYEDRVYYSSDSYSRNYDISIANGYQTTYFDTLEPIKNYTMPFKLFRYGLTFSWSSNCRMIILSIVYFALGLKLYQKRKMEHSEDAFGSQRLHIFVKSLTLVPILLFVNALNQYSHSITPIIITIILCGVYYFIFDIVSKRKVPLQYTIAAFATTIVLVQATSIILGSLDYKSQLDIDADDIKSISVGKNSNTSERFYYYYNTSDDLLDGDFFIQDDQILQLVLDGKYKIQNPEETFLNSYNNGYSYDEGSVNIEIYFNIKLKNGKVYYIRTTIPKRNYNEIQSILARNDEYIEHMQKKICSSNGVIQVGNDIVDPKTKKRIENIMKDDLDVFTNSSSINYITKSVYQNHEVKTYRIPLKNNEKMLSVVAEFANQQALENIKGYRYDISVDVYNGEDSEGRFYSDSKILDFMELHGTDEFDPSQKYYILSGGLQTREGYKSFIFYTNSTKEIDKLLDSSSTKYLW